MMITKQALLALFSLKNFMYKIVSETVFSIRYFSGSAPRMPHLPFWVKILLIQQSVQTLPFASTCKKGIACDCFYI